MKTITAPSFVSEWANKPVDSFDVGSYETRRANFMRSIKTDFDWFCRMSNRASFSPQLLVQLGCDNAIAGFDKRLITADELGEIVKAFLKGVL